MAAEVLTELSYVGGRSSFGHFLLFAATLCLLGGALAFFLASTAESKEENLDAEAGSFTAQPSNSYQWTRIRQERRAPRLTFWIRRPHNRVGVFHAKGCGGRKFVPLSKVRSLHSKPRENKFLPRDVPGILPDVPDPWGCSKEFMRKKFVLIARPLKGTPHVLSCPGLHSPRFNGEHLCT